MSVRVILESLKVKLRESTGEPDYILASSERGKITAWAVRDSRTPLSWDEFKAFKKKGILDKTPDSEAGRIISLIKERGLSMEDEIVFEKMVKAGRLKTFVDKIDWVITKGVKFPKGGMIV